MTTAITPLPPGPSLARVLWLSLRPLRDHSSFLSECHRRYGDPFSFPGLQGPVVTTCDTEAIKGIFAADPDTFASPMSEAFGPFLGENSVLLVSGKRHRAARRLLMPPFNGARMRAYGTIMRDAARAWGERWQPGQTLSVQETTLAISLEVIIRAVFGVQSDEGAQRLHQATTQLMAAVSPLIVGFPALRRDFGGLGPWARYQRLRRDFEALLRAEIEAKRAQAAGAQAQDILSLLVQARYEDGQPLSEREILDQLISMVVAGHETVAVALAWAVYALHRNPATLTRLRAELDAVDATAEGPDPDALAALPYLDAVCQETLRRYPLAPLVQRKLARPYTLQGRGPALPLPAGTLIGASLLVHFDPAIYPDPQRFDPDRFLSRSYAPSEFLAFGGGARRCLGAAFATQELRIVLGTLLRHHQLRLLPTPSDRDLHLVVRAATIGPESGVRMVYEGPRSSTAARAARERR